ncbi:hypothetical protein TUM12370_25060 [Salmonella enterica subsp. enterica serovar Choleraesuis]|nr:hypothetical protein TUM12370_25060 [Salmonella enterica subsp. enterica serovar Choleraesuis]
MVALSRLYLHPVKSMRALRQSHAMVQPEGLAFDRQFMVTEPDGTFITARQTPELVLFTPALTPDGLFLQGPDGSSVTIRFADFAQSQEPTEVWGNHFTARIAPEAINQWLSQFFQRPVQLRWTGPASTRRVEARPDVPLSFADGYPFLLTNESSLRDLQQRCPASVSMEHFRPNLVVTGTEAWAEDSWKVIRIGQVVFDVVKPCSRCIFTTISPARGKKHPSGEPLRTLQQFRSASNGDVDFGQNLIARNSGIIQVGDEVEILKTGPAKSYAAGNSSEPLVQADSVLQGVAIDWQGNTFTGDNQQVLLEQLEQQGIRVPYSCRAGICGCCRVRLLEGEVKPLRQGAVDLQHGTILSCSCVPLSALKLEKI